MALIAKSNLYFACSKPAAAPEGSFIRLPRSIERRRHVSLMQSFDQVVAANEAAFLVFGATARLHVAVLLTRDDQNGSGFAQRIDNGFRFGARSQYGRSGRALRLSVRS